ncbi:MAG: hypothetical protein ABFQ65_02145 [Nanoarchaeota archaeon]
MGLINLPQAINELFPKVPIHSEKEKRKQEAKIVSLYSNGQISLYLGKYNTTKDIKKRRENLAKYKF